MIWNNIENFRKFCFLNFLEDNWLWWIQFIIYYGGNFFLNHIRWILYGLLEIFLSKKFNCIQFQQNIIKKMKCLKILSSKLIKHENNEVEPTQYDIFIFRSLQYVHFVIHFVINHDSQPCNAWISILYDFLDKLNSSRSLIGQECVTSVTLIGSCQIIIFFNPFT